MNAPSNRISSHCVILQSSFPRQSPCERLTALLLALLHVKITSTHLQNLTHPQGNKFGRRRRPYLRMKIRMFCQTGSHPIVWYCNRLSPDNPHVRGLQLYYWLCSMSVILILRALGTFDKILWDENSLLPHHPCAWNLQRFWIWSPSFHCRKKNFENVFKI